MSSRMRQRFDGRQGFLKVNCPRRYSAWKLRVGRWATSGNVRGCDLYTAVNQAMQGLEVPVTMRALVRTLLPPADGTGWLDQSLGGQGSSIGFRTCSRRVSAGLGSCSLVRELNSVNT